MREITVNTNIQLEICIGWSCNAILSINHNLVMIIASTTSSFWISDFSLLLGGSSNSALAVFTLSNRLLIWFPVLFATGTVESGSQDNTTRWYSGLGSSLIVLSTLNREDKRSEIFIWKTIPRCSKFHKLNKGVISFFLYTDI